MPAIVGNETRPQAPGSGAAQVGGDLLASILAAAESAVGVQYRWGGNSLATGVDCSGLVQQAFRAAGIALPRVSAQQATAGQAVDFADAQPGDLLWYDNSSRNNGADHIAIYLGNGLMIEAPQRGKPVRVVAARKPTGTTRVLGAVQPTEGIRPPTLGPNGGRDYTVAALGQAAAPGPTEQVFGSVSTDGGLGDDLPPNASPQQVEAYLRTRYPQVAPFLANEEIKNMVFTSVRDGSIRNAGEFERRFRETTYYKTHSPSSQAFDALIGEGGTAAGDLVDKTKRLLADRFSVLGLESTDDDLGTVAKNAIRNGWVNLSGQVVDQAALDDFSAFALGKQTGEGQPFAPGAASVSAEALAKLARDYGVTLPQSKVNEWTMKILQGQQNAETYEAYVKGLAKAQWSSDPDIVKAIDSGVTLDDYFAPHRSIIERTLELAEGQVDVFGDPKWQAVTQFYDPALKAKRSMTLGEVADLARKDARFAGTRAYKEQDAQFALRLGDFLGKAS